jgi:hypothetical protein
MQFIYTRFPMRKTQKPFLKCMAFDDDQTHMAMQRECPCLPGEGVIRTFCLAFAPEAETDQAD